MAYLSTCELALAAFAAAGVLAVTSAGVTSLLASLYWVDLASSELCAAISCGSTGFPGCTHTAGADTLVWLSILAETIVLWKLVSRLISPRRCSKMCRRMERTSWLVVRHVGWKLRI